MHLDSVGKPHSKPQSPKTPLNIILLLTQGNVNNDCVSEVGNKQKAYRPKYVYKLAQLNLASGGRATRASTNADTYAWLANCLYFFVLAKYF